MPANDTLALLRLTQKPDVASMAPPGFEFFDKGNPGLPEFQLSLSGESRNRRW